MPMYIYICLCVYIYMPMYIYICLKLCFMPMPCISIYFYAVADCANMSCTVFCEIGTLQNGDHDSIFTWAC